MPDIVMPRLSDSMEEGAILTWLKKVGDEIAVGDEIVEIETDKANMAYESDVAGTLTEILAQEGETLAIGTPIARVGDAEGSDPQSADPVGAASPTVLGGQAASAPRGTPAPPPPAGDGQETAAPAQATESNGSNGADRVKASPVARRIAKEKGIDLSSIEGSGPGGRIVKKDVKQAAAASAGDAGAGGPRRGGASSPEHRGGCPRGRTRGPGLWSHHP